MEQSVIVCGQEVDLQVLEKVATAYNATIAPNEKCRHNALAELDESCDILVIADMNQQKLQKLARKNFELALEYVTDSSLVSTPVCHNRSGMVVIFNVRSAYRLDIANMVLENLKQRGVTIARNQEENIYLCLHEGIMNAIMYGSLDLEEFDRDSFEHLAKLSQEIENRLIDPDFAGKSVIIESYWNDQKLAINVIDQKQKQVTSRSHSKKFGRGLGLIKSLTHHCLFSPEKQTLHMEFK